MATDALVIWDFDGVIADSEPLHVESYKALLREMGNDLPERMHFGRYIGHPEGEIWEMMRVDGYVFTLPLSELIRRRESFFLDGAMHRLSPTWVVREVGSLVEPVCERQVVVSNGQPTVIAALLAHWNLDFLEQLHPQDLPGKKHEMLTNLWGSANTVTIEDSAAYLDAAGRAGSGRIVIRHSLNGTAALEGELELTL
jgi:phosphoglycolate phosphatase-like HAD superfamily hydrolase